MTNLVKQCILVAVYYIAGSASFLTLVWQVHPYVIQDNWMIHWNARGCLESNELLFFMLITAVALKVTFVLLLCILFINVDILLLVTDKQEELCFVCLWLFTHAFYTLIFFAGLFSIEPLCINELDQIVVPFLLSIFNAMITCTLLVKMNDYRLKLKFQQDTNIPVYQNTISMEVQQDVTNENNEDRPPPYSELFKST